MDQRTIRTREAIFRAYEQLLEQYGDVNRISVKELACCAGISRSTFYSHYPDMNELTNDITSTLAENICNIIKEQSMDFSDPDRLRKVFRQILLYLSSRGPIAKQILLHEAPDELVSPVLTTVLNLATEDFRRRHLPLETQTIHAISLLWTYGTYGLAREWFREDCKTDVSAMVDRISDALTNFGTTVQAQ